MNKWDQRFMEVARLVATWSKDPSSKIGVVLVKDRRIIATGYNGFPVGVEDSPERLSDRPTKYALVVHAEMNALLQVGPAAKESTLYLHGLPGPPCAGCAKHIVQAGVSRIVTLAGEEPQRWADEFAKARLLLNEGGIRIEYVAI